MRSADLSAILVTALLSSLIHVTPAVAQEEEPEVQKEREANESAAEADPAEGDHDAASGGYDPIQQPTSRARGSSRKLHRQLTKLQGLMKSRLELTKQQEEAIDALFEQRLGSLRQRQGEAKKPRERTEDREAIRELRHELLDARKANDRERILELRRQLGQILRTRRSADATSIRGFLLLMANELNKEQVPPFRRLVKHVGLDKYGRARMGSARELMRAVMSPEVGLSREQRRAIRDTLREAMSDTTRSTQDPEEQERFHKKLRAQILAQLEPEQRAKVEAALEQSDATHGKERRRSSVRDRDDVRRTGDADHGGDTGEGKTEAGETEADETGRDESEIEVTGHDESTADETSGDETAPEKSDADNP